MKTITIEKGNDCWMVFKEYYWMPTTYNNDMPAAEVVEKLKALYPDTDILVSAWLNSGGDDMGDISHLIPLNANPDYAKEQEENINKLIQKGMIACVEVKGGGL